MRAVSRFLSLSLLAFAVTLTGCGGGGSGGGSTAPATPTGLTITPGARYMTIAWDAMPGASSYSVYVSSSPDVDAGNYGYLPEGFHVPGIQATFTRAEGLRDGATYYARVEAHNDAGTSALSPVASGTLAPPAVANVSAASGIGSIRVSWGAALGALSYDLFVAPDASISSKTWTTLPGGMRFTDVATGFDVPGLLDGRPYFAVVVAHNAAGSSLDSAPATATPSSRGTFTEAGTLEAGSAPEASVSAETATLELWVVRMNCRVPLPRRSFLAMSSQTEATSRASSGWSMITGMVPSQRAIMRSAVHFCPTDSSLNSP